MNPQTFKLRLLSIGLLFSWRTAWPFWLGTALMILSLFAGVRINDASIGEAVFVSGALVGYWIAIAIWCSNIIRDGQVERSLGTAFGILVYTTYIAAAILIGATHFDRTRPVDSYYVATLAFLGNNLFDTCNMLGKPFISDAICRGHRLTNMALGLVGFLHGCLGIAVILLWLPGSTQTIKKVDRKITRPLRAKLPSYVGLRAVYRPRR